MQIILNKNVPNLGKKYEVKTVAAGYARNFLIPSGLAEMSTEKKLKSLEKIKAIADEKAKASEEALAKEIAKLSDSSITLKEKANEKGHLFAQIHAEEIISAIKDQLGLDIEASMIHLENPIKEVGESTFEIKIGDKKTQIKLIVESL